ncbi:MAG: TIGR03960 family B12-binding radical SAM protein [Candidatus Cloacimonetes bacterium]|nr:TIGR03960 family B12-binding radical SAM protein [Candidatus Cloacimonadota bacterium]
MQFVDIQQFLPLVQKPSRYIGKEINAANKDPHRYPAKFCLAFPDVYELGVSHLGLKILYSIINQRDDAMADRVYLPWTDLLDILYKEGIPLFGLESGLAVRDFDVLGITLQSEITYSSVLELIDVSQIPVLAAQREEHHPIVLAGGPCASNPLPLSEVVDVFFIGEAEEAIEEIAAIISQTTSRSERLIQLAEVSGCYVPRIHDPIIARDPAFRIKARKYNAFHTGEKLHQPQLLSWQLATHNRYVAEIMRGCSRGCRFCQAGFIYRPVRERNPQDILSKLVDEVQKSGWDEVGLMSLSSSDYTCIQELLTLLWEKLDARRTHVSLPSLRVDSLQPELVRLMGELGREGLTIAPEAGSQRLRDVINKNLSLEEILRGVQIAKDLGWNKIKLYFMLGLPTETDEDIDAIIDLINQIDALGQRRMQVNVTLSPFVPKPVTPFQRCAFADPALLLRRAQHIKGAFARKRNIKIRYHVIENSLLDMLLARGDRKVAKVLYAAWQSGARFDGWNEHFAFPLWEAAIHEQGLGWEQVTAAIDEDKVLPWSFIDYGVTEDWLRQEYDKALEGGSTPDCREICSLCGVCDDQLYTVNASATATAGTQQVEDAPLPQRPHNAPIHRYRIHYHKLDALRFISHLDWMRMLFRIVGQMPLDTVFTQGFSPHPRVSLSPPLPLGVESRSEYFDMALHEPLPEGEILRVYQSSRIPGLHFHSAEKLSGKGAIPSGERLVFQLPASLKASASNACKLFVERDDWSISKRDKQYQLREIILSLKMQDNELHLAKTLAGPSVWDILAELMDTPREALYAGTLIRIDWLWD